jgi:excinuclease ABC subunit C
MSSIDSSAVGKSGIRKIGCPGFAPLRLCMGLFLSRRNVIVTLDEKLKEIPKSPGVYLYKNSTGKIIYIGKAKNLRNRVRSYFQGGRPGDYSYGIKTAELVRQIADVEIIVTDNEVEAFIL